MWGFLIKCSNCNVITIPRLVQIKSTMQRERTLAGDLEQRNLHLTIAHISLTAFCALIDEVHTLLNLRLGLLRFKSSQHVIVLKCLVIL